MWLLILCIGEDRSLPVRREDLATFDDRYTLRYVRVFHPRAGPRATIRAEVLVISRRSGQDDRRRCARQYNAWMVGFFAMSLATIRSSGDDTRTESEAA